MASITCLTLVLNFGAAAVLAAVRPATRAVVTSFSLINKSTTFFPPSHRISTTREVDYTTMQDNTKHVPINCSDTKSVGEVFSCILQGMLSEPILIGIGIVILLAAFFVVFKILRSEPCKNGCKPVQIDKDEVKKMVV